MGKERPELLRLRVRGTKKSVETLMEMLQPMLERAKKESEKDVAHWRIGRNLRVSGTEHIRKVAQYEWHIMVPAEAMVQLLITVNTGIQLETTTEGEKQGN